MEMRSGRGSAALPADASVRIDALVRGYARRAPGLLDRVIVTGSLALGDWQPGRSDIDLVLVVTRGPTAGERAGLAALHAATSPPVDGVLLTEAQLAAGPDRVRSAPQVTEGVWRDDAAGGELSWITWREVEQGFEGAASGAGVPAWAASTRRFDGSDAGARAFSRRNLREYWAPLGARVRASLEGRTIDADALQWIGLGPARLAATAETGAILSKSAAGRFAAERWPDTADLLGRLVAARGGASIDVGAEDALLALDLLDRCVAAAGA